MVICKVCKRQRKNLPWRDWNAHLKKCEREQKATKSTTKTTKFMVSSLSSSNENKVVGGEGSLSEGDLQLPVLPVEVLLSPPEDGGSDSSESSSSSPPPKVLKPDLSPPGTSGSVDCSYGDFHPIVDHTSPIEDTDPSLHLNSSPLHVHDVEHNLDQNTDTVSHDESSNISADPSSYCKIKTFSHSMVDAIMSKGPNQPEAAELRGHKFPTREDGRAFHSAWYFQTVPDGSSHKRDWLSYSPKEDKVFCQHCILFGSPSCNKAFTEHGFHAWQRATTAFIIHETSEAHVEAALKANLRKISLPINASLEQQRQTNKARNKEIVRKLIDVTLYLARHNAAFRGHREGFQEKMQGNFRDLVALLGKYSPAMASYLATVNSSSKKKRNFLSWRRQNQYIQAAATFIRNEIKKELQDARFFSISVDETMDSSRKEQVSFFLRYVCEETGTVSERLGALKASASTTGDSLFKVLTSVFDELNLDWRNFLVGQAYDGASNMRGAHHGLQSLVRQEAVSAVYIWCWSHRLSLAVKESVDSCLEATELFTNVQSVYNLINGSKNHVDLYESIFKEVYPQKQVLRLKRVDTPRWMSPSFALGTVINAFDAIIETVDQIKEKSSGETKAVASGLLTYFLSEKFVFTALTFSSVFDIIEPLSASLQGVDVDLLCASNHVDSVLSQLAEMRSDEGFKLISRKRSEFISLSKEKFSELPTPRLRRVRTLAGEKAQDEPISDPVQRIKVQMYFVTLDSIYNLISERFNDDAKALIKDLSLFSRSRMLEVQSNSEALPKDAFAAFSAIYCKFLQAENLQREYLQFVHAFFSYESALKLPDILHPYSAENEEDQEWVDVDDGDGDDNGSDEETTDFIDVIDGSNAKQSEKKLLSPNYMNSESLAQVFRVTCSTGLKGIFPSLYTALKIAVTLPVTSASTERSFSKLKLIKTRLRSTMSQLRLEDLMIISCENDIAIDIDEVVKIFAYLSTYLTSVLL